MQSPEAASAWALEPAGGLLDVACVDGEQPDTSIPAVTASIPAPASAFFTCFPSRRPAISGAFRMATTRPMAPAIVAVKRRNLSIAVGIAHCLRYLKRNNRQVLRSPCCNAYLCGIRARVFIGGAATLRAAREK